MKMDLPGGARRAERGSTVRWLGAAAAALTLFAVFRHFDVQGLVRASLDSIAGLGAAGPAVFVLIYVLAAPAFVPCSLLTLGAGAVFGVFWGTVWTSIAATLGATAAFLIGRYAARAKVEAWVSRNPRFRAVERAVAREGLKIVFLVRLSPAFPYNLLNYAFSLSPVSLRDYVLGSWAGMIPGTILYVYLGSLAGSLAALGAGGRSRTAAEWALYGVGLAATIAVTVYVTRLARRALAERVDSEEAA